MILSITNRYLIHPGGKELSQRYALAFLKKGEVMGTEYYLICEQHEQKTYVCKHWPSAERLNTENLALFFSKHMGCDINFVDDNCIANMECPMPFRNGEYPPGIQFDTLGDE